MDLATPISAVALLGSAASIMFARQSAAAAHASANDAKRMADIETERRHDERRPVFAAEIESVNEGGWFRLVVILLTQRPLDRLTVQIVDGKSLHFAGSQSGVDFAGDTASLYEARLDPLTRAAAWRVDFDDDVRGQSVVLAISSGQAKETWDMRLKVDLPPAHPQVY
jgi:hypothetical protein